MRYYPVNEFTADPEDYGMSREQAFEETKDEKIWTLSTNPNEPGWDTDNGLQKEGGLTYALAVWFAEAANEKLEREGGTK